MPTAPSVNGRGKAWLTDGGVVFAEASVSQSNRFAGFFPLLPACCEWLAAKIEVRRKDSAAPRHAAPGTLLKCSAARPVEMVSLIRVEAISSGDRGAAVPRRSRATARTSPVESSLELEMNLRSLQGEPAQLLKLVLTHMIP
ncbi:unnamed protein product [Boreogadus saida]